MAEESTSHACLALILGVFYACLAIWIVDNVATRLERIERSLKLAPCELSLTKGTSCK